MNPTMTESPPLFVDFTTSVGCSVDCVFCPQNLIKKKYSQVNPSNNRFITFALFKEILAKIPKNVSIVFCGEAEPFLNPECTDMALFAHQSGYEVYIFTTLTGISLPNIKRLFDAMPFIAYPSKFRVHLPSKEKLENIVVSETYKSVLTYILEARRYTTFHYHGKELNPVVEEMLAKYGYKATHIELQNRAGNLKVSLVKQTPRKRGALKCSCWGHNILPDGTVAICSQDYGLKHVIGHLGKSSYQSLMDSPMRKKILRGFKDEKVDTICRYCSDSRDANGVADYFNNPFTFKKIPLGLKIYFYNYQKPLYKAYLGIKSVLFRSTTSKEAEAKRHDYLGI